MLAKSANRHPEKIATETVSFSLTYQQLHQQVIKASAYLAAVGLQPGDKVMLFLPNSIEFIVSVFAIARLGGIVVPVNTALEITELTLYLTDSGAKFIILNQDSLVRCGKLIKKSANSCQLVTDMLTTPIANPAATVAATPATPVLYQYTSGSSGQQKRIVKTHANLLYEAKHYTTTIELTESDRILTVVPMHHAHGFGNCLLAGIYSGARLVILENFSRAIVMEMLLRQSITVFPGVPFMFSILADSTVIPDTPLSHLRLAFTAGAPLTEKIFTTCKRKFSIGLRQLYGSTETGSISINRGAVSGKLWASVGQPIEGVKVKIVTSKGHVADNNESGEIAVSSAAAISEYAGLAELNRRVFREGYFFTGDLGYTDKHGNLFITGRKTLFINVGGNKVDPVEIETVLNQHPDIVESVVLGVPGAYGDEMIKAVIASRKTISAESVKQWCQDKLASFKLPRKIEFCEKIPRSPLGKVLRKDLLG